MIMPRMLACPQTHKIMKLYSNLVSNPDQRKQIYIKYSRTNSTIIYIFAIKTRKPSLLHRSNIFIANFILLYCFAFSKNRKKHVLIPLGLSQKILSQKCWFQNLLVPLYYGVQNPKILLNFAKFYENIFGTTIL